MKTSFLAKEVGDFILLYNRASSYVHHHFNVNSLQSSFSATMTLDHHIEKLTVLKQCLVHWRLAILLLFMWLNSVTSTKLRTYPGEESSHHVVQQTFFLIISFLMIFVFFCFLFFLYFFFVSFFFLYAWLNSAKDTKLPTYPRKRSSHHVVQKFSSFFSLINFF